MAKTAEESVQDARKVLQKFTSKSYKNNAIYYKRLRHIRGNICGIACDPSINILNDIFPLSSLLSSLPSDN